MRNDVEFSHFTIFVLLEPFKLDSFEQVRATRYHGEL